MSETIGLLFPIDKKHWWQVAVRGFIALLFGILLLAWPGVSLFIFAILFGAFAFVDGIFTLVAAVNYTAGAGQRTWLFIRGICGIIVGIVTFFWPAITEVALVLLIGAWALVTGVMELNFAFRSVRETGARWLFAISGILSIILGILLLIRPIAGIIAVIWLIGAYAVIAGILLIILGFRLRSPKAS
ncbi:MAG: HdeD family acid-resistance protein [Chloroflexi bacterium]|nr:HdeD family acid-resistance protein [Chloroflexota bacterium]